MNWFAAFNQHVDNFPFVMLYRNDLANKRKQNNKEEKIKHEICAKNMCHIHHRSLFDTISLLLPLFLSLNSTHSDHIAPHLDFLAFSEMKWEKRERRPHAFWMAGVTCSAERAAVCSPESSLSLDVSHTKLSAAAAASTCCIHTEPKSRGELSSFNLYGESERTF